MPPKRAAGQKRKAGTAFAGGPNFAEEVKKKSARSINNHPEGKNATAAEKYGIVLREFYPPEMTNKRALQYIEGDLEKPMETLDQAIEETADQREKIKAKKAVVHWFKRDLRTADNKALHYAAEKAKENKIPLICMFIVSPQDYQAHLSSPLRVDFELRTLEILKKDLAKLDIPLYVETIDKRKQIPGRIIDLCKGWGANHIYCNIEYEVDELRREALLTRTCVKEGISFTALHDTCVVHPGQLHSQAGKQYAVYSPWFRAWVAHLHDNPEQLELYDSPGKNPESAKKTFKDIFEARIPSAPANKALSKEEKKRYGSLWPAGEHEAQERLEKFLNEKIGRYKDTRNFPAANSTAVVSVHLSSGTLSARTAVRKARDINSTKKLDGGNIGITGWISEVAWRDFYKHVLVHWPYVCMNKPFKPEYTNIDWEYDEDHFKAWCDGRTGFPLVDAAMRQLNETGYMHNRCRMTVASFLAKDLMIDWRMGERYFMEHLIDGDFASNNGGWGFSASTGVDPQPYFRIFNPISQSERFDGDGEYIRKWVPELAGVKGSAIHEPYARGAEAEAKKRGYPEPLVEHKESRNRALARYKEGLGRATA